MTRTWSRAIWNVVLCCGVLGISCNNAPRSIGDKGSGGAPGSVNIGGAGGAANGGGDDSSLSGIGIDWDASVGQSSGGQDGAAAPTEDANCGILSVDTQKLPANLLLVLDRSNSMNTELGGTQDCPKGSTTCVSRWKAITDAVTGVLPATQDMVNWGLKFYGTSSNGCDVSDAIDVAPGPGTADQIAATIAANQIYTGTPTTLVVEKAGKYMAALTDPNPKFILLATDGQPYCGGVNKDQPDDQNAIDSIKTNAFDNGVKVFVVGVAINAATVNTLNQMADAGGTGSFYPADSPAALNDALAKISGIVANCNFKVSFSADAGTPDPKNIAVFLDGERLPNDGTDGWVLSNNDGEVDLTGKYCDAIKNGTGKNVQVLIGCAPVPQGIVP